ncbi:hypothetical protein [Paenochrobactrum glaciei]|uniref:Uncharacterized protein n=1 Tax=Paenochrobactrum glaciei TaxID=486407 RepID=A0ABN1GR26_9HYPH
MMPAQENNCAKKDSIELFNVIVVQAGKLENVGNMKPVTYDLRACLKEIKQPVTVVREAWSKQADANRGADYAIYSACEALAVSFEGVLDKVIVRRYADEHTGV